MKTSEGNPEDWFALARDRLQAADVVHRGTGVTLTGVELLHEAVERVLKGYLVGKGWRLEKTHDLGKLIREAGKLDSAFLTLVDFAENLNDQFWI